MPNNDNINNRGEKVALTFGAAVTGMSDFMFRSAGRLDISGSADDVSVSVSTDLGVFGGNDAFANVESNLAAFGFAELYSITFSASQTEYSLSSFTAEFTPAAVPLPASVLLFGGGAIGGLGACAAAARPPEHIIFGFSFEDHDKKGHADSFAIF